MFLLERLCCRILQPSHVGPEDRPGGSRAAGEGQSSRGGAAHGPVPRHLDPGDVTLVHLPLHRHPPDRGEETSDRPRRALSLVVLRDAFPGVSVLFQTVLRVWDCLFYEGSKVLFRVALTLIIRHQPEILRARSLPDVCECFRRITSGAFTLDCHAFMQVRMRRRLREHARFGFHAEWRPSRL